MWYVRIVCVHKHDSVVVACAWPEMLREGGGGEDWRRRKAQGGEEWVVFCSLTSGVHRRVLACAAPPPQTHLAHTRACERINGCECVDMIYSKSCVRLSDMDTRHIWAAAGVVKRYLWWWTSGYTDGHTFLVRVFCGLFVWRSWLTTTATRKSCWIYAEPAKVCACLSMRSELRSAITDEWVERVLLKTHTIYYPEIVLILERFHAHVFR